MRRRRPTLLGSMTGNAQPKSWSPPQAARRDAREPSGGKERKAFTPWKAAPKRGRRIEVMLLSEAQRLVIAATFSAMLLVLLFPSWEIHQGL